RRDRAGARPVGGSGPAPPGGPAPAAPPRESAPFDPAPVPFSAVVTEAALLDALEQRGYKQTTPIQSAVLPYAMAGRDVIGCAETGTGKTAAYVLPLLSRLIRENRAARAPG